MGDKHHSRGQKGHGDVRETERVIGRKRWTEMEKKEEKAFR